MRLKESVGDGTVQSFVELERPVVVWVCVLEYIAVRCLLNRDWDFHARVQLYTQQRTGQLAAHDHHGSITALECEATAGARQRLPVW